MIQAPRTRARLVADHFEIYGVTDAKLVRFAAHSVANSRGFQQGCAKFLGVRRGKFQRSQENSRLMPPSRMGLAQRIFAELHHIHDCPLGVRQFHDEMMVTPRPQR